MRALRLFSVAVVGAVLAGALTACDGGAGSRSSEAEDAINASVAVMRKAGNGSVELVVPAGLTDGPLKGLVKGSADWTDGTALDLTAADFRMRSLGDTLYRSVPAAEVKGGRSWTADRATAEGGQQAPADGTGAGLTRIVNPVLRMTSAARSGTLSLVGSGPVDGVETKRYRSIEPLDALVTVPGTPDAGDGKPYWPGPAGVKRTFMAEFALNAEQELVQLKLFLDDRSQTSMNSGGPFVLRFSGLGRAPRIVPPAASEIVVDPRISQPADPRPDGPSRTAAAALRAAAAKAAKQNSYRTARTGPAGSGQRSLMVFDGTKASEIESWGNPEYGSSGDGHRHMILMDGLMYSRAENLPGKSWLSMKFGSSEAGAKGFLSALLGSLATSDDVARVATEDVGGRPAEHYRGTVELTALAGYRGAAINWFERDMFVREAEDHGLAKVGIDVWIGADGLPVKAQESGSGSKGAYSVTEEYSAFGADPRITAPAAADVIAMDDLLGGDRTGPGSSA
ncbi:hypothetical protein [Kitasatospora sp. NPDC057223]|uniref:hypothetical protein n=1 Tax=Kitasatospora sp. NPDC057223 TaxID=3346055 RepID=UPI00362A0248